MGESGRTGFSKLVENKSKVLTQTWGKECIPLLVVKEPSKCNLYWNKSVWPLLRKHGWTSVVCALPDLMRTDRGNLEFLLNVVMADRVLCWHCLHPWVDKIRDQKHSRQQRRERGASCPVQVIPYLLLHIAHHWLWSHMGLHWESSWKITEAQLIQA